jgi:hypothetical protein
MRMHEHSGPSRSLRVTTKELDGYLRVRFEGKFALDEALASARRVFEQCYRSAVYRVLLDARGLTGRVSLLDKIEYAESLAELQMEYGRKGHRILKIAHVLHPGRTEAQGFAEMLAENRGAYIFLAKSVREALDWLGEGLSEGDRDE